MSNTLYKKRYFHTHINGMTLFFFLRIKIMVYFDPLWFIVKGNTKNTKNKNVRSC